MQEPKVKIEAQRRGKSPNHRKPSEKFLPVTRYVLTNDINVDLTSHVSDYVRGNGTSQRFRQIVPGHHKWQAFGPKHSLRKHIWVQPYIRGDESLPMAIRKHRITEECSS